MPAEFFEDKKIKSVKIKQNFHLKFLRFGQKKLAPKKNAKNSCLQGIQTAQYTKSIPWSKLYLITI